jgi:hypothetical protein
LAPATPEGWNNDPDVQRMLRARDGDSGAFQELFLRHSVPLLNLACRYVGSAVKSLVFRAITTLREELRDYLGGEPQHAHERCRSRESHVSDDIPNDDDGSRNSEQPRDYVSHPRNSFSRALS